MLGRLKETGAACGKHLESEKFMDIRLRILRRIIEIGSCKKYHFDFDTHVNRQLKLPITHITVFTGEGEHLAIADTYRKYGTEDEKAVFGWLDTWAERFEEARKNEAD